MKTAGDLGWTDDNIAVAITEKKMEKVEILLHPSLPLPSSVPGIESSLTIISFIID